MAAGTTITETANSYVAIIFNKNGTQTFTKTMGTISNNINFTVNAGSNLDMGTSVLNGSAGTFTLSSGATITTAHAQGISSAAGTGCIQSTGVRTFSSGANYVYNGLAGQVTGVFTTTPTALTVSNLTINNAADVTLSQSFTINGLATF